MSFETTFGPIPSLDYRYEIDIHGTVRNAQTKRVLKRSLKKSYANLNGVYRFVVNGVEKVRTVPSLLYEVHGIEPEKTFGSAPVGVFVRKGGEAYSFSSIKQAAKFLSRKTFYSYGGISYHLQKRHTEIEGWRITYREPEKRKPLTGAKANGDCELKRHTREKI